MANGKKKKKPILYPVVFMVVISAVFTGALASLNAATIDRIKTQEEVKVQRSLLYVFNQDVPEDIDSVQSAYRALVTEKTLSDTVYFQAEKDGEVLGYAFPFQGSGLWGTIWGYIAVSPDFNEIIGVDFLKHSETPGLGGRISEPWYRDQFRGIDINAQTDKTIVYRPSSGGNADAITGATLTSQAVQNMINNRIVDLLSTAKGDI